MTKDEFRQLAAGKYYFLNRGQTIDIEKLEAFVEGAVMAYDVATAQKIKEKELSTQKDMLSQYAEEKK